MQTQVFIGSIIINSYTFCVALGALGAGIWVLWQARHSRREMSSAFNRLLIVAVGGLIVGRAGYVLLHADYFREHLAEIAAIASASSPGYSEHAAIAGGLLGWAIATRLRQSAGASALIVLATLIGVGASIGCAPNGCAYGREVFWTDGLAWQLRVDWPDAYLLSNPRLPVQLFMAGWLIICLIAVGWITARRRATTAWPWPSILLWLLLFAAGDFVIQFLRADPAPMLGPLRIPQWADIALVICSGGAWLTSSRHPR